MGTESRTCQWVSMTSTEWTSVTTPPHPAGTGETMEPSTQSRTRDTADHAGPSPQSPLWRLPPPSTKDIFHPSPSKSLLTAHGTTVTTVAMEDGTTTPMTSLPLETTSQLRISTHTLELMETPALALVLLRPPLSPMLDTPLLPATQLPSRPLLPSLLPMLPSLLETMSSAPTPEESSWLMLDAQPESITLSPPSDTESQTELSSSPSETHGVSPGVRVVTSEWSSPMVSLEPAESMDTLPSHNSESIKQNLAENTLLLS